MQTQAAENQQPRYCHLHLEQDLFGGWIVTKESGAQSGASRVSKKYFETFEEAENETMDNRDKQIKLGYRVVFIEGLNNPQ